MNFDFPGESGIMMAGDRLWGHNLLSLWSAVVTSGCFYSSLSQDSQEQSQTLQWWHGKWGNTTLEEQMKDEIKRWVDEGVVKVWHFVKEAYLLSWRESGRWDESAHLFPKMSNYSYKQINHKKLFKLVIFVLLCHRSLYRGSRQIRARCGCESD